jgi:four helix bundle protein
MGTYRDLIVYQKAYQLTMDIFERTKGFPSEEKFSLTLQIRKSSRSVCANFVEAYRRRKYKPHFVSKLTDSLAENTETQLWLDISKDCKYIELHEYDDFANRNEEVGRILWYMIENPDKFM